MCADEPSDHHHQTRPFGQPLCLRPTEGGGPGGGVLETKPPAMRRGGTPATPTGTSRDAASAASVGSGGSGSGGGGPAARRKK